MTTQSETLEGPDESNADEFAKFAARGDEGPVMMLNLLKFKLGGAEGYAAYGAAAGPIVQKFGGKGLFAGRPSELLLGDKAYDWDMMVLVEWPKRQNLLDMTTSDEYQAVSHLRGDSLVRSVLYAIDPAPTIG
jgi:uncharacterized protein (DUF1330 family)